MSQRGYYSCTSRSTPGTVGIGYDNGWTRRRTLEIIIRDVGRLCLCGSYAKDGDGKTGAGEKEPCLFHPIEFEPILFHTIKFKV